MHPIEVQLQGILRVPSSFSVPLYQRPYSWRVDQHDQLWRDLVTQYRWTLAGIEGPRHFIGSIVVLPRGDSPQLVRRWDLVDGQQRITTLLILLAALRDAMGLSEEDVERFNNKYLLNEDGQDDDQWKAIPGPDDRIALQAVVGRTAHIEGHQITKTYDYFEGQLAAGIDSKPIDLEVFLTVLLGRVKMIRIEIEEDDSVYQVFESLNATGKPLDQVDLLRSFFFSLLGDDGKDSFLKHWREMEISLGDYLEAFLWSNLVRQGHYINQSQIYRRQQQVIGGRSNDKKALIKELERLHKLANVFLLIDEPSKKLQKLTLARIKRFKQLGLNEPAYPVVLYVLARLVVDKTATDSEADKALAALESYLVRRLVVGKQTNNLNRMLGAALEDIAKEEAKNGEQPVDVTVIAALSGASRYWPTDSEIRNGVRTNHFYSAVRSTSQKTFVLREVVYSATDEKPDLSTLQIEHIMPDTLSGEWRAYLDESPEAAIELHSRLRHTLGNLTLIGSKSNPAMRNVLWSAKRPYYKKSNTHNQALARDNEDWKEAEIALRAEAVAEAIISAWPGPIGNVKNAEEAVEELEDAPGAEPSHDLPPIREWASEQGLVVASRGPIPKDIREAYSAALAILGG